MNSAGLYHKDYLNNLYKFPCILLFALTNSPKNLLILPGTETFHSIKVHIEHGNAYIQYQDKYLKVITGSPVSEIKQLKKPS